MIVMHAGPHKTATTYIQHNLQAAKENLLGLGWLYPDVGKEDYSAHHDLAHNSDKYFGDNTVGKKELSALANRPQDQNLIFSAEGFCRWGAAKLKKFSEIIGAGEIDIVYVVRNPVDVFYSYWAEEIKQGYSYSLPQAFSENFANPMASRLLNPLIDIAKIKHAGMTRIHVVPFEVLRERKINVYSHILESVMGLHDVSPSVTDARNTSFPIELTEFLRLLTLIVGGGATRLTNGSAMRLLFTSKTTPQYRDQIVELMKSSAADALLAIDFPEKPLFSTHLARRMTSDLSGNWTIEFEQDELYGSPKKRRLLHYNAHLLMKNSKIMDACREALNKIGLDAPSAF